ncbi:hypothetical protein [Cognatilysobacter bugurensis]|uniref:Outer membrane lipoprotein carrier protein LolA n=1 Tax=Cognatilysobacter bugurensis TaxID=543356 RepID=A0A918T1Q3_9GAMM|nr:hypothetical protein [Lysobacter bugurensis]GHA82731.1 hypothetical protein GCM10007067_20920 [Lysobacter bugurensis]
MTRLVAWLGVWLPLAVWAADPREEVNAAVDKLLTARSYQAALVSADGSVQQRLEFEAPGRYRIRTGGEDLVVIGDVLHRQRDGATAQAPLPQEVLTRWRDPARLAERVNDMDIAVVGDEAVAGVPARKYRIDTRPPAVGGLVLWVGIDGYPVQILARGAPGVPATLIRYARFNDATIDVEPPR